MLRIDARPWFRRSRSSQEFAVIGVYRRRNAETIAALTAEAGQTRLWALDDVSPLLSDVTVGVGPGTRFGLLNALAESVDRPYLVVADDDVRFERGSVSSLVDLAHMYHLDLCQAAHSHDSNYSLPFTLQRPLSSVRLTNFVEIGPLLVVGPAFRDSVLPFPNDLGMGWGAELEWMDLGARVGARYGIVDAVTIKHLNPVGATYDTSIEFDRVRGMLAERGAASFDELHKVLGRARPWNLRRPGEHP